MRTGVLCLLVVAACGGSSGNGDANGGDDTPDAPVGTPTCDAPAHFAEGLAPTRTLHVDAAAAPGGDGSAGAPYQTIEQAAAVATPGTWIKLAPGPQTTSQYVDGLRGTATAPIWIGGEFGSFPTIERPLLDGGVEGLHLTRPAYVVVHDLEVANQTGNGINIDDGGDFADELAAHHVLITEVTVRDVGGDGNQDCIKVSGVNDLFIYDSSVQRCGGAGSGSGIDHVGCHRSIVARNTFYSMSGNAVQAKGGSTDVDIRQNRVIRGGERVVNLGGSTDLALFRPPLSTTEPNAEARRIRVFDNVFIGTMVAAVAFVGCTDCLVAHNIVVGDPRWLVRILQETATQSGYTFEPARDGQVINNSFVFDSVALSVGVNVGTGTAPETFSFSHNLWLAADDAAQSTPSSDGPPFTDDAAIVGVGSAFVGLTDPFGSIACTASAPEADAGVAVPGVPGALDGRCWPTASPPSIGAAICE